MNQGRLSNLAMELEMKTSGFRIEMQHRAAEALRSLLSQVSSIKLKEIRHDSPAGSGKACFVAHIDIFGHPHALACHVKSNAERTNLRATLEQLRDSAAQLSPRATPMLIAPYLPPEAQSVCKEFNAAYLDLAGNARLVVDEVFIVRRNLAPRSEASATLPAFVTVTTSEASSATTPLAGMPHHAHSNQASRHSLGAIAVA
jgi:hypothetical protein